MRNSILKYFFFFAFIFSLQVFAEKAEIPFELVDNRIFVQIRINGQGPFVMMLDTGASNILDSQSAALLKIPTHDSFKIEGGGEFSTLASYGDVQLMDLAGLKFLNQQFIVVDLSGMKKAIGFKKFDGLIGYEVFSRYIAEVNFDKKLVTLTSPDEFNKVPTGEVIPFIGFDGGIPLVEATIDGIHGKFWLDTGDRAAMTLTTPFIQANHLKETYKPNFTLTTGWGIAGPLQTQIIRVGQVQLGQEVFLKPVVRLPTATKGGMTSKNSNGTIGNDILRRFNLTINYFENHIVLDRNTSYSQDFEFERTGMWLMLEGSEFKVLDVFSGSPADKAGIKTGDIITAIDHTPTSLLFLPEVRTKLSNAQLGTMTVTVKTQDLVIHLANLLK